MPQMIPQGLRDLLPADVKRERKVIETLRNVFEKFNYERIVTPSFEYYATLAPALSEDLKDQSYKFLDDEGQLLMLRVDHTTPIARVAATRMQKQNPIRLYYSGDVFRKAGLSAGQDNQFHQLGVELIGVDGKKGDDEVLELAEKCLRATGLRNFQIHTQSVKRLSKLSKQKKDALLNQDFVSFGRLPQKEDLLLNHHDYYDGLIFEIAVPELGYLIGSGGRYNHLLGKFGKPRPAVGFAISLGRLILALEKQK